jgi:glycosyltransferase involved in cell wall biosynthesis
VVFIIIGRNEGARLARCIASLPAGAAAVYVDSGSTDGSCALAARSKLIVQELDRSKPFSAARARNEGAARAATEFPNAEFYQFLDGDCELHPKWMTAALELVASRRDVAVVCGRRRERFPDASLYNRLMDLEWDTPIGEVVSCGGDALFLRCEFERVGGFDELCLAGEEPELCARIVQSGKKVVRIADEMTTHDANILTFSVWWRRQRRSGYGGIDSDNRQGRLDGNRYFHKQIRSAWMWGLGFPVLLGVGTLVSLIWSGLLSIVVFVLGVLVWWLQVFRIASHYRRMKLPMRIAVLGAIVTLVSKFAHVAGQVGWYIDRSRGKTRTLMEYKTVQSSP